MSGDNLSIALLQNVPQVLRHLPQWVCWRLEKRKDKQTKVPYTSTGGPASATDSRTWATLEECVAALKGGTFNGIGFVFADGGGFTGIDLDGHRNPQTGELDDFAKDIVAKFESYSEASQSGTGVHIIVRGAVPGGKGKRNGMAGIEIYSGGRYFVMTGDRLPGTPATIEDRQPALLEVVEQFFGRGKEKTKASPPPAQYPARSDNEVLQMAWASDNGAAFTALFRGDFSGYPSQSEADAALLSTLRFWTGGDKDQAFRLFAQSGLNRDKWGRADYREATWGLVANGEVYSAKSKKQATGAQRPSGQPGQLFPTPCRWFSEKYPSLVEIFGDPVLESENEDGTVSATDIAEDFLAATLGEKGTPAAPTVFLPTEDKFFAYSPNDGLYLHRHEPVLLTDLSKLLLGCARACKEGCDTKTLEFRFRDTANLSGVLRKARGLLAVPSDYFSTGLTEFIPCANGMLRQNDKALLPFSPTYRRRNKLAVPFDPAAACPLFLDTLMVPALDADDLDLIQRWCGLALIGVNLAQKMLLLIGTAGGGKGTLVRVINGIIGQANVASLRTHLLNERFELGRLLGKTLLYGADVPESFLNQRAASVLKSLTGGDPVTLEFKNSNDSPSIICQFNVIVTCNSRLTVHLEGDTDAWARRLAIVEYNQPRPKNVIADLSERILASEGSGVLNWQLAGLDKVRADGWQLRLTSRQQARVENLLLESDGHAVFARECLARDGNGQLTLPDCFAAYVEFCTQRGWNALTKNKFGSLIGDELVRQFAVTVRHDIPDEAGKPQRGWRGIAVLGKALQSTGKKVSEVSEIQASDIPDNFPTAPNKDLVEEFL